MCFLLFSKNITHTFRGPHCDTQSSIFHLLREKRCWQANSTKPSITLVWISVPSYLSECLLLLYALSKFHP
jgi:hypothetical protein